MTIQTVPLTLPPSADPSKLADFGREVIGVDPGNLSSSEFADIRQLLYKYDVLLFRNANLSPEQQYALTKAFEPVSESHGHGNYVIEKTTNSILHSYLITVPRVPQVQLVGNGTVYNHEGIESVTLRPTSHTTFHKTVVSPADEAAGVTRFYRWHMDAALYDLDPPRVTALYAIHVPQAPRQTCRYDDGTGDVLPVPLGATAFISGKIMFDILPRELQSVAVRSRVRYAPHPYIWMAPVAAHSTGLAIESEGKECSLSELPPWTEDKIKVYPATWKNPVTGSLHFQVHPCAVHELLIDPLPEGATRDGALYPDGARLTDLKEVRDLVYKMQRPAIAPNLVYPHDWKEKDLILFHNRGVMHTVVGTFGPDQVRMLHQCHLAASDEPMGPAPEDVRRYT